jgi:hypothetical protein
MSESATERLAAAHSEMRRACDLLIAPTPEAMDSCQNALQRALSELVEFRSKIKEISAGEATQRLARGLRGEVLRAARLLQNLAGFYRGWERILGAMTAGYTASGDPAPVTRLGRLNCRG